MMVLMEKIMVFKIIMIMMIDSPNVHDNSSIDGKDHDSRSHCIDNDDKVSNNAIYIDNDKDNDNNCVDLIYTLSLSRSTMPGRT